MKLKLSPAEYIDKVLKGCKMRDCKPVRTSLSSHFKLSKKQCTETMIRCSIWKETLGCSQIDIPSSQRDKQSCFILWEISNLFSRLCRCEVEEAPHVISLPWVVKHIDINQFVLDKIWTNRNHADMLARGVYN